MDTPIDNDPSHGSPPDPLQEPNPSTDNIPDTPDTGDLEKEIDQALGDINLIDLYDGTDTSQTQSDLPKQTQSAPVAQNTQSPTRRIPKSRPMTRKRPSRTPPPNSGICRGKVISIDKDDIFIDLGGKSQGLLHSSELDPDEHLEPGQEIDVIIVNYDPRDGLVILSKKAAQHRLIWSNLKKGSEIEAQVTGRNKGGLEMDIKGIPAFMPASQVDVRHIEDLNPYIGQTMTCHVIETDYADKKIILSRRSILHQQNQEKAKTLWADLKEGQIRRGTVQSLTDFGAFVDLGGADGLLHIQEMCHSRAKHPKDILNIGQEIDVCVLKIDPDQKRISLSLRNTQTDPWHNVEQKFPQGTQLTVRVTRIMEFGAFAELSEGLEGLIPVSQMSWAGIKHPSDILQVGSIVEAEILSITPETRRISLSMKSLQENPWKNIGEKYQRDMICEGQVARLVDFGAFIKLEDGIDGFIHISELSPERVEKVTDILKQDQQITAKVLNVDPQKQRIALSLKALDKSATTTIPAPAKKQKKQPPRRGGLSF